MKMGYEGLSSDLAIPKQELVDGMTDGIWGDRLRYPENEEDFLELVEEIETEVVGGKHVVIVDGSFDVPHPNHQWYLTHARVLGEYDNQLKRGVDISDVPPTPESDEVFLVVTLDTDQRVANVKSSKPGNRPVYPWRLRAMTLCNFMVPTPEPNRFRPVVDLVAIDADPSEPISSVATHRKLAEELVRRDALGTWVIYEEHGKAIDLARTICDSSRTDAKVRVIDTGTTYMKDENGIRWNSSGLVARILGDEPYHVPQTQD
ncbi:MAG TPA: hypothetical protein VL989_01440 [Candidatus Sulfotelmatobacter sp.]|nr:hypothetical protein [Candidatus Sulfotelmatobacter sp.]